jgi:hypothetical protein
MGGGVVAYERLVERYQDAAVRVAHVLCGAGDASDAARAVAGRADLIPITGSMPASPKCRSGARQNANTERRVSRSRPEHRTAHREYGW